MEEMIFHDRYWEGYSGKTVLVGLNEAKAVSAAEAKHCLGTTSLLCCAGIAIHDPSRKVAAAAHLLLPSAMPNEPNPVAGLAKILADLLSAADASGGSSYILTAFNFAGGARDEQLSKALCRKAQEIASFLRKTGKLIGVRQRHERQFVLDSRSGEFYTGAED
jgi:chemotaxis receptor (MCP) glutamine deamidase CheD